MTGRSAERHDELCDATLELLVEVGYDRLTMDQVAARARASKATLYRWWSDKRSLVADALVRASERLATDHALRLDDESGGSLREDLRALVRSELGRTADSELLQSVLHACLRDPELAAVVRERVVASHQRALAVVVERAVRRGEVPADSPALPFLEDAFAGPLIAGELLRGRAVDEAYLMDYVDAFVLPALDVTPSPTRTDRPPSTARRKQEEIS